MQDLGLVGIRDRGIYDPSVTYNTGNFIYWEGSTYKVLRDNVVGITPSNDGTNYGFLARGFVGADAEDITITDTYGEVVAAGEKTLVQRIIDRIVSTFVKKSDLSSSGAVNTKNAYAADAWQLNESNTGSYAAGVKTQINTLSDGLKMLSQSRWAVDVSGFNYDADNLKEFGVYAIAGNTNPFPANLPVQSACVVVVLGSGTVGGGNARAIQLWFRLGGGLDDCCRFRMWNGSRWYEWYKLNN